MAKLGGRQEICKLRYLFEHCHCKKELSKVQKSPGQMGRKENREEQLGVTKNSSLNMMCYY